MSFRCFRDRLRLIKAKGSEASADDAAEFADSVIAQAKAINAATGA